MNIQNTILQQYQRFVDQASQSSADLTLPPEGWLRTMRKALGMSGAQLARKMGVSRVTCFTGRKQRGFRQRHP